MKKISQLSVAVAAGVGFFYSACVLGENASNGLSMSSYISDSLGTHPRVLEQVHIFRQSQQDQAIAKSGWLPSVDLTAITNRIDGESPTVVGSQGVQKTDFDSHWAEIALTQNLFNGFDTQSNQRQAQARMRAALFQLFDTADNIALESVKAYIDVLKNYRLLELARNNVSSHEDTVRKIERKSSSGVGRRSQLEQAEGRLARAQAGLVAQQNNLQDALSEAHQVLGRYVDPQNVSEPVLPPRSSLDLDAMIDLALSQHPALQVAHYNIEAAKFDRDRARSKYYPKLDLRLAQEVGEDLNGIPGDTDETTVALTLSYNFYNGGADRAESRKRTSAIYEQQHYAANVRRQVINSLRLAWVGDKSLNEQLRFLEQYVVQAKKTVVSYKEEFFIGQRDLLDLLDAQSELNAAQTSYLEGYFDAVVARYRVLEATGGLFQGLGMMPIVEESNLKIVQISASGIDELPLNWDRDTDLERDSSDHCDNSVVGSGVNRYGCLGKDSVDTNSTPVAGVDQFEVGQGGVIELRREELLANDVDGNGDSLSINAFTQPDNGVVERNARNALVYRAAEGFLGVDTFTYVVSDGISNATGMVSINVVPNTDIDFGKTYYVRYIFAKTSMTEYSKTLAKKIIRALNENPSVQLSIDAYTDSVGSDAYNMDLSLRRAQATRAMLVRGGVELSRISVVGGGESNPLADNSSEEGRAINRRGEFRFTKP